MCAEIKKPRRMKIVTTPRYWQVKLVPDDDEEWDTIEALWHFEAARLYAVRRARNDVYDDIYNREVWVRSNDEEIVVYECEPDVAVSISHRIQEGK